MKQLINLLIKQEDFQIRNSRSDNKVTICIISRDEKGAMYRTLDLMEQIHMKTVEKAVISL